MTRRELIKLSMAIAGMHAFRLDRPCRAFAAQNPSSLPLVGVNLAGAEFGDLPGRHTYEYQYPSSEDVAYFADLGFNCLRVPFRWERLQPALRGDFAPEEEGLIARLVGDITGRGLVAVLDPHNYAKRLIDSDKWSSEHLIGSQAVPTDAFVDFWRRLALMFKDNDRVIFGLMNEPAGISADAWLQIANRAIVAIRDTGAKNLLTVPGTAYTGAHSWLSSGNAALAGVIDPLNHFAIEVHQYFDDNSSGTSPKATSGSCGSDRLRDFQNWARKNRLKAFLGEFAAAANPASLNALADICQEMSANPDVWLGWTAWAAGPFWPPDYMFNLGPAPEGGVRKQTRVLAAHAKPASADYWVRAGAVIDLDLARERIHGCSDLMATLGFAEPRLPHTAQAGSIRVEGPLRSLMQQGTFTLLVETEALADSLTDCDIVSASGRALLARTAVGALRTAWGGGLQTIPQRLANWRLRRRSAIAVQQSPPRVAIGATGCGSLSRAASLSELDEVVIGAGHAGGRIVRVTAFTQYMDGPALDDLIA
jgi:endoglucanase